METLSIEWRRPAPGEKSVDPRVGAVFAAINRTLGAGPVAAAMRVNVDSPAEASRVFNALGAVLRALTVDDVPAPGEPQGVLDPRDG